MKAFLSVLSLCFVLATGTAWAGLVGTTNPGDFEDTVDWCQFGCAAGNFATPQPWLSAGGATGLVGLSEPSENFYNFKQGTSWSGNFPDGMGMIYNGSAYGNTPVPIALTFDAANYGAGAWITSNTYGPFTATITLYDADYQELGSYTMDGVMGGPGEGSPLFLGLMDTSAEVWAAEFVAYGGGAFPEPDFAIGLAGIRTSPGGGPGGVPEPATFLLIGPALLAAGLLKKRLSR